MMLWGDMTRACWNVYTSIKEQYWYGECSEPDLT